MHEIWKTIFWQQFGGAIEMLENAMSACPDDVWSDRTRQPEFWYLTYHTLFWLDFYLSESNEQFAPPAPFNLDEMDPAGLMPDQVYSKAEMRTYLEHGRGKARALIAGLTDEKAAESVTMGSFVGPRGELLLNNMRHVQHHAAQLNLILRQQIDAAPRWVRRTSLSLCGE